MGHEAKPFHGQGVLAFWCICSIYLKYILKIFKEFSKIPKKNVASISSHPTSS
jgi:hypothetical protein